MQQERTTHIRQQAITALELTKGFIPEQRAAFSNELKTVEEFAHYILELTSAQHPARCEWVKVSEFDKKQNVHYCGRTKTPQGIIYATIYWDCKWERFVNFTMEGSVEFEILIESPSKEGNKEREVAMMCWAFTYIREWDKEANQIYLYSGKTFHADQLWNEWNNQQNNNK
jgi:hypothetical protein